MGVTSYYVIVIASSQKYKIVPSKKKELEDLKDLFLDFIL
jgi:hypothetical protein